MNIHSITKLVLFSLLLVLSSTSFANNNGKLCAIEISSSEEANALLELFSEGEKIEQKLSMDEALALKPVDPVKTLSEIIMAFNQSRPISEVTNLKSFTQSVTKEIIILDEMGNASKASVNETVEVLIDAFPARLQASARQVVLASQNSEAYLSWIQRLRDHTLTLMYQDGIRGMNYFADPYVMSQFLDRALAQRAKKHGFSLQPNENLWDVTTDNEIEFFRMLKDKKIFLDWTGPFLTGNTELPHSVRGHALQLVYYAEHIPQFAELISYIGENSSPNFFSAAGEFWRILFDNALNDRTVYFPAFFSRAFGYQLNIPN